MRSTRRTTGGEQYASLEQFYAARPERERSGEVDFGVHWHAGERHWPSYRLSWVEATGELYLFRQAGPETSGPVVRVLATIEGRDHIEEVLDGWVDACGAPQRPAVDLRPQRAGAVRRAVSLRDPGPAQIKVCGSCGYGSDGDYPILFEWPCPTYTIAQRGLTALATGHIRPKLVEDGDAG